MNSVLIVSAVYPPEPVVSARLSRDIYEALCDRSVDVKVLHPKATRPEGYSFDYCEVGENEIIIDSFTCARSSFGGRFRESISFGRATFKYIKQNHTEISKIYANTWPLFGQFFLVRAAKKFKIPCYIHVQDIYPESYCHKLPQYIGKLLYKILFPLDRYVLKNAAGVFAISPAMKRYLSKSREIEDSKIFLVRNWQDDQSYIKAYKRIESKSDIFKILYLGSINPTANVPLILNSVAKLNNDDIKLTIVGNGPEKEICMRLASKLGLDVEFGTVVPEQVAETQGHADALVLCLRNGVAQTATPSKLTAYMLTGRPIIASVDLDSDCANIIREAGCGLVVEPENEVALSEAIRDMSLMSHNELCKMGKSAFDYAIKNLSKEKNLSIIIDKLV